MFRSRWFRNALLTLFILLLVVGIVTLGGYVNLRGKGERHQAQALTDLDAKEPGWRYEQIQAARQATLPPPEKNVIEQAVKLRDRFPPKTFNEWAADTSRFDPRPGEQPSDEELTHAHKLVDLCKELIPDARNLRHLSGGVVVPLAENPIATLLPHVQKAREVAALLQQDALVCAVDGRTDDALDDALAVLALARGLDGEPFLISQLVRVALASIAVRVVERTLSLGTAADAKLAEVQAAMELETKASRLLPALRGERAGMSKLAELLKKDPEQADGLIDGKRPPKAVTAVATSALLPETHARYLELMTRAIAIAEKPSGPERNDEFAQIDRDVKADTSLEGQALRLAFPAISKCYDADVRTTALLQMAVAAIAHKRSSALAPVLPADPYTGKPVVFKKLDDGFAVYSTGPDKTDDGGTNLTDGGTRPGCDWGVRLYDPKKR